MKSLLVCVTAYVSYKYPSHIVFKECVSFHEDTNVNEMAMRRTSSNNKWLWAKQCRLNHLVSVQSSEIYLKSKVFGPQVTHLQNEELNMTYLTDFS